MNNKILICTIIFLTFITISTSCFALTVNNDISFSDFENWFNSSVGAGNLSEYENYNSFKTFFNNSTNWVLLDDSLPLTISNGNRTLDNIYNDTTGYNGEGVRSVHRLFFVKQTSKTTNTSHCNTFYYTSSGNVWKVCLPYYYMINLDNKQIQGLYEGGLTYDNFGRMLFYLDYFPQFSANNFNTQEAIEYILTSSTVLSNRLYILFR